MLGKTFPRSKKRLHSIRRAFHTNNEGLTLLESLVAIIVLTIAISTVTPPIFLAVATRVQNRKAEQAMQLAQKYTDRIRGIVEQGEYSNAQLPKQADEDQPVNVPAPSDGFFRQDGNDVLDSNSDGGCNGFSSFDPSSMPAVNEAMKVDVNGDCEPDFFVQIFRSNLEQQDANELVTAFPMGVRVYSMAAEENLNNNNLAQIHTDNYLNKNNSQEASLTPTQGFGDQTEKPLAVIYTNVVYSEAQSGESLNWYRDLLN
ncbi:type II secretion system protein [Geitlerinema sp. PCC 9228]|uniref:type IV pilus modification PilV family protein n=1 Tax=Geitlerinema sp. PCC 9228 TaxID=111611 RepID=UPI0008F99EE1|nr:type II secretion system protein [Geitlerinema sp. PCC 9228]